jgi:hypothetical protein
METRAGEFFENFAQNNKCLRQKLWVSPLMNQFKSISRFSLAQNKLCELLREIFQKVNKTVRKTNASEKQIRYPIFFQKYL